MTNFLKPNCLETAKAIAYPNKYLLVQKYLGLTSFLIPVYLLNLILETEPLYSVLQPFLYDFIKERKYK